MSAFGKKKGNGANFAVAEVADKRAGSESARTKLSELM